ncbi:MAG: radical SAM protein [Methanogenium sp.]|nr:radical SAM protein [Methanogenium sp.]
MEWKRLKARLLASDGVRISGMDPKYIEHSHAGPGTGGSGSFFFSDGKRRVRLSVNQKSDIEITQGDSTTGDSQTAELRLDNRVIQGIIEQPGLHCPRQAYITVSEGCLFGCRYCSVPNQEKRVKTAREVESLVESVNGRIDAISLTSGVVGSVEEDERRVLEVVRRVKRFNRPTGVSIYPSPGTPARLRELGVAEVKFNIETATEELFDDICPGLDRRFIFDTLTESVALFGRNHVFSNVILGLGESDYEMERCITELAQHGVIPVVRPLTPSPGLPHLKRPSKERILKIFEIHERILIDYNLDTRAALTMCTACTGCDLVPGRDS